MKRGALIVFEGCDRSGKSTQLKTLYGKLKELGASVQTMQFSILMQATEADLGKIQANRDRTTTIGKLINEYLKGSSELDDHVVHLLFSANRWEVMRQMEKQLQEGTTLLVDRYLYSGIAFSAAKGLDLNWCAMPDSGLLKPDLVIFLDLDPQLAVNRGDYGSERYEKVDFQSKVYANYLKLKDDAFWKVINADRPFGKVEADIYGIVSSVLNQPRNKLEQLDLSSK